VSSFPSIRYASNSLSRSSTVFGGFLSLGAASRRTGRARIGPMLARLPKMPFRRKGPPNHLGKNREYTHGSVGVESLLRRCRRGCFCILLMSDGALTERRAVS
jgi:hypothetical protein